MEYPKCEMKAMHSDGLPAEIAEAFDAVQKQADACADEWNRRHAQIGSFADEHSTL
jgi:hypothetical protein